MEWKTFREIEELKRRIFIVPNPSVRHGTLNIENIHPLKQEQVHSLCNAVSNNPFVKDVVDKIWIFGSSINNCCNIDSDLDILVSLCGECDDELYCQMINVISHAVGSNFDLSILQDLDPAKQFYKNIMKNRRLVYERAN